MAEGESQKPYKGPHYAATRHGFSPFSILLTAKGTNATTGWKTYFEVEAGTKAPVRVRFVNRREGDLTFQSLVPFEVTLGVISDPSEKQVVVDDSEGSHTIDIH